MAVMMMHNMAPTYSTHGIYEVWVSAIFLTRGQMSGIVLGKI